MTVGPIDSDASNLGPKVGKLGEGARSANLSDRVEEPDKLEVKAAGEGAVKAKNPFENLMISSFDSDSYAKAVEKYGSKGAAKAAGVGSGKASSLIETAKKFIGTPYKWGGSSPLGFDCSGFTQYVFKQFGIELPRVSYQQASAGKRISVNELRPGDLVFWDNSSRNVGADHVAIALGNGYVIHAPSPGQAVKISKIWDAESAWGAQMNL